MAHEPRGLVGDPEHAGELKRAHALLARNDQMRSEKPLVKWDMAALIERTDAHREFFAALIAEVPARSHRLAAESLDRLHLAAERANRTFRPARGFQKFAGFVFVSKGRVGQIAGHGISPMFQSMPYWACSVKYIIPA